VTYHPRDACGLIGNIQQLQTAWLFTHRRIVHQPVPPIPPDTFALAHRYTSPRLCVPMSGVTGSGCMICTYQNQIPPAFMVLLYGGFPEPSRSLAESVLSTLEPALTWRVTGDEIVASRSRLATITNSRTSTRTVIAVICFIVQLSSDDARGTHSISPQQLCRLFRYRQKCLSLLCFMPNPAI
jgi:hypothetical protein